MTPTTAARAARRPDATPELLEPASWLFEEVRVGQTAAFEVTVSDTAMHDFARATGDHSSVHADPAFARRTRFRAPVAHGMLAASYMSTLAGMYLPGRFGTLLSHQARYLKPIAPGDRLTVRGEVTAKQEAGRLVTVGVTMTNQRGQVVITGAIESLVSAPPKKGLTMDDLAHAHLGLDFTGHVVLVTGASRGIGEATAKLFAHHGARVVLNYWQGAEDAQASVDDITAHGGEALAVQADVRDEAAVRAMVQQTVDRFGRIDVLVNNAMNQAVAQPFAQTRWDDMQADLDVALRGAFNSIHAVLPAMTQQGRGKIISVTTVYTNSAPPTGFARYVAAKSALLGLTRALAVEYAPHGIHFNVVSPGLTDTDLAAHVPDVLKRKMAAEVPLRKIGEPLDVAKAVVLMASGYTDYVVGGQLLVCGGSTVL